MSASLKILNEYFKQLKEAYDSSPQLRITDYFDELKRKVDIAFNAKIFAKYKINQEQEQQPNQSLVLKEEKEEEAISTQYKEIIKKIEEYENECLSNYAKLYSEDLKKNIGQSIKEIEQKLTSYEAPEADEDDEDDEEKDEIIGKKNESFYSDADYKKEYDFGYGSYNETCFSLFRYLLTMRSFLFRIKRPLLGTYLFSHFDWKLNLTGQFFLNK